MSEEVAVRAPGTWYRSGPATLVRRGDGFAVLIPGIRKEVVEAAWTALAEPPQGEDFVAEVAAEAGLEGPDSVKALIFGTITPEKAVIGVKGSSPIAVCSAAGREMFAGTEETPVVVKEFEGPLRVSFGELPREDGPGGMRVDSGIVGARGFVHMVVDIAELDDDAAAALRELAAEDDGAIEDEEAKKRRAERPAVKPRPKIETRPAPKLATPSQGSGRSTSRSRPRPTDPEDDGPNVFADMFGGGAPAPGGQPVPAAGSDAPAADTAAASEPVAPADPAPATVPPETAAGAEPPSDVPAATAPEPTAAATDRSAARAVDPAAAPQDVAASVTPAPGSTPGESGSPAGNHTEPPGPAEAPAAGGQAVGAVRPKRRLVSTSLFDRARASGPREPSRREPAAAEADPAPSQAPTPSPRTPAAPAPAPSPEAAPSSGADPAVAPTTASAPAGGLDPSLEMTQDPTAFEEASGATGATTAEPATAPADPAPATTTPEDGRPPSGAGSYDELFGATVHRKVEDAAVRVTEDDESSTTDAASEEAGAESEQIADPVPAEDQQEQAAAPEALAPAGEFIDWVPGVGRPPVAEQPAGPTATPMPGTPRPVSDPAAPSHGTASAAGGQAAPPWNAPPRNASPPGAPGQGTPAPGAPTPSGPGQFVPVQHRTAGPQGHDARGPDGRWPGPQGSAPSMPPGQVPSPVAPAGAPQRNPSRSQHQTAPRRVPTLPALICPSGHPNPPDRPACGACGARLGGPVRTVGRPPRGVLELSTGDAVRLDRSAVIGRKPRASRVSGDDVPQLITVPSPQHDISRSHVEIRLEGWHVVAEDLATTNGTRLSRGQAPPMRLRPHDPVVLQDLDVLDLGDGVVVRWRENP